MSVKPAGIVWEVGSGVICDMLYGLSYNIYISISVILMELWVEGSGDCSATRMGLGDGSFTQWGGLLG